MRIEMIKFGKLLNSRPSGSEAYLRLVQIIGNNTKENVVLDFSGVDIVTPSYADELLSSLYNKYGEDKVKLDNTDGVIKESIEIAMSS